jgi:2-keto-4-pentenoate hydratase/2-oxohepta-3-ene-1,7-dioic acid hydratase in catechol pathway
VRIARFTTTSVGGEQTVAFGVVDSDATATGGAVTRDTAGLSVTPIDGHPFAPFGPAGDPVAMSDVRLLAPVLPSKIVAFGRNYAEHANEMGNAVPETPIVFLKPSTSVIGPGEPIAYPPLSRNVAFEGELAVVIARLCREVPIERVPDVVLGYTCANDVTARDLQETDGQWGRAKGFDTFCPLGPWISTGLDTENLRLRTTVNGELRQDGTTAQMLRGVAELVSYVSAAMTLLPGDVILTGTPAGVGPLAVGDEVSVTIEGIGTLTNPVVAR